MTEHDYEKALMLLYVAEEKLSQRNPDDAHILIIEVMRLLQIPQMLEQME